MPREWLSGAFLIGLVLSGSLGLSGCGSNRPTTAPVQGKITCGGQPVPEGVVTFYPEQGRPATGRIQPDGTYRLTTFDPGDGALVGKHKVTIEAVRFLGGGPQPKSMEEEIRMAMEKKPTTSAPPQPQWLVPQRYAKRETTPLVFEVRPGPNTANFDLPRQ